MNLNGNLHVLSQAQKFFSLFPKQNTISSVFENNKMQILHLSSLQWLNEVLPEPLKVRSHRENHLSSRLHSEFRLLGKVKVVLQPANSLVEQLTLLVGQHLGAAANCVKHFAGLQHHWVEFGQYCNVADACRQFLYKIQKKHYKPCRARMGVGVYFQTLP
jgi:hypothetical protein